MITAKKARKLMPLSTWEKAEKKFNKVVATQAKAGQITITLNRRDYGLSIFEWDSFGTKIKNAGYKIMTIMQPFDENCHDYRIWWK